MSVTVFLRYATASLCSVGIASVGRANGTELSRCDRASEASEGAVGWSEMLARLSSETEITFYREDIEQRFSNISHHCVLLGDKVCQLLARFQLIRHYQEHALSLIHI